MDEVRQKPREEEEAEVTVGGNNSENGKGFIKVIGALAILKEEAKQQVDDTPIEIMNTFDIKVEESSNVLIQRQRNTKS